MEPPLKPSYYALTEAGMTRLGILNDDIYAHVKSEYLFGEHATLDTFRNEPILSHERLYLFAEVFQKHNPDSLIQHLLTHDYIHRLNDVEVMLARLQGRL